MVSREFRAFSMVSPECPARTANLRGGRSGYRLRRTIEGLQCMSCLAWSMRRGRSSRGRGIYERMKGRITELTRSKHALRVLDSLFDRPIFPSGDFLKRSGISRPTGLEVLRKLRDAGILNFIQEARGSRSALFAFRELLNITEGRTVF